MTERSTAASMRAVFALVVLPSTTFGCRAAEPTLRTEAKATSTQTNDAGRDAGPEDDECRPPEWQRVGPDLEDEGDELTPPAPAVTGTDAIFNDTQHGTYGDIDAGGGASVLVARVHDDAADSPDSILARYPFFPIRAHGLPAVSADGSLVALIDVKPSVIAQGAEFDLDLYDVAHDRLRTRVVLWSYAEEDAREDLNDSLGTALAAAKRMDGRMSRANALLRATSPSWQPLGKMERETNEVDPSGDDEDVYFGAGLRVVVANGHAHVTSMHFPSLRTPSP